MVNACKSPTTTVNSSEKTTMKELHKFKSDCPDGGTCEIEIHKNKKLEMRDDQNGGMYSEIVEGNNLVIEYSYLKPAPEGIADGNYFETIQFEVPANTNNLTKENAALADVKLVFSKHGFRKSDTFRVTNGKLSLQKSGDKISLDLNFKVKETSQVISQIKQTVKL